MIKNFVITFIPIFFLSGIIPLGAQTWKWATGSNCPHGSIESWPITVDKNGNTYEWGTQTPFGPSHPADSVISYFGSDSLRGESDILVSTDSNGVYRWAINVTAAEVSNMITGPDCALYLFGVFSNSITIGTVTLTTSAPYTGFIAKLDSTGHAIWLKKIDGSLWTTGAIQGTKNIYVAGTFNTPTISIGSATLINASATGLTDVFLAKYDTAGNPIWAKSFGGDSSDNISGVSTDFNGNVYIAGAYTSPHFTVGTATFNNPTAGAYFYFYAMKYDSSGNPKCGENITNTGILSAIKGVASDLWGNEYITGMYNGTMTFGTLSLPVMPVGSPTSYLAKYNSNGVFQWAKSLNDFHYPDGDEVSADICGNIWICTGNTYGPDYSMLVEFDSTGIIKDTFTVPAGGDDERSFAIDNRGNLYFGGDYMRNNIAFGPDTLKLIDSTDETLFIAKLTYPFCAFNATLSSENLKNTSHEFELYPNPAYDECTISNTPGNPSISRAELYDITGKIAGIYPLSGNNTTIIIRNVLPGFYMCRIYTDDDAVTTMKLVITK